MTDPTQPGPKAPPRAVLLKFRGHRVCDGYDPEGNVIQLRQPIE